MTTYTPESRASQGFPPILTLEQAAHYLQIHPQTLRGWVRGGRGPAVFRAGAHYRFRLRDVEAWVDRACERKIR